MKWYIFLSVQRLRQIATLKRKLRWETGLLNTSQTDLAAVRRVDVEPAGALGARDRHSLPHHHSAHHRHRPQYHHLQCHEVT